MDMTWNTATSGMCIVFKTWHVQSAGSFVFSLAIVFAIGVGYEYLKRHISQLDAALARRSDDALTRRRYDVLPTSREAPVYVCC
ncbi:hypothetical protein MCUN1_002880 [Malassezia cuniculi]|uniref:Copper transport protein n=1 Tax=Malassezia cuniculi TaxID=948313 RepID=A0AAF0EVP4_9BASI|nr:hypothetical protein MCUN1_002880 [Malassezia cuniculi]